MKLFGGLNDKEKDSKKRRSRKQKKTHLTCQAPLCAFGEVMKAKDVFALLHGKRLYPAENSGVSSDR